MRGSAVFMIGVLTNMQDDDHKILQIIISI